MFEFNVLETIEKTDFFLEKRLEKRLWYAIVFILVLIKVPECSFRGEQLTTVRARKSRIERNGL